MEKPHTSAQEQQAPDELKMESFGSTVPSIRHPAFNSDSIGHSPFKRLAVICDGFGDLSRGMSASQTAIKTIAEGVALIGDGNVDSVKTGVQDLFARASTIVGTEAPGGETAVVFAKFFKGNKRVVVGSLGNSRAYIFRDGNLFQMTVDDDAARRFRMTQATYLELAEQADNASTDEEVKALPAGARVLWEQRHVKNKLLDGELVTPQINTYGLQDGDEIILTSPGVHNNLTRSELHRTISITPAEKIADVLTSTASTRSSQQSIRSQPADASAIVIKLSSPNEQALPAEHRAMTTLEQDFKDFLKKHASESQQHTDFVNEIKERWIDQAAADPRMAEDLQDNLSRLSESHLHMTSDLVYKQFYGRRDELQVADTATGLELVKLIKAQRSEIGNLEKSHPDISIQADYESPGWLFAFNKSKRPQVEMTDREGVPSVETGRFYINIRPEYLVQAFSFLAQAFVGQDKRFDLKTHNPDELKNPEELSRRDGMVLYFHQADFKDAAELLRDFTERFPDALNPTRPRFTAGLVDKTGKEIPGIGFGQEPDNAPNAPREKTKTFGRLRADMLAELVTSAHQLGLDPTDPKFDFQKALIAAAQKRDISLENPAFNDVKGDPFRQITKGYLSV